MVKAEPSPAHEARKPNDADRFVGQRLRQGRRELGLTQEGLAALLGVTFQQIQKYEGAIAACRPDAFSKLRRR